MKPLCACILVALAACGSVPSSDSAAAGGTETTSESAAGSSGSAGSTTATVSTSTDSTDPGTSSSGAASTGTDDDTTGRPSAPAGCSDPVVAQGLPEGAGWHELPGTTLEPHCPPDEDEVYGTGGCQNVVNAWNGGVADTCRSRLLFLGGGHNDYYGNEVYALDLAAQPPAITRLTDPSVPPARCEDEAADGNPASRHTYNGLAYMGHSDSMFVTGGATACPQGIEGDDTWTFRVGELTWTRQDPVVGGPVGSQYSGKMAVYDRQSEQVIVHDTVQFVRYDPTSNAFTPGLTTGGFNPLYVTPAFDPNQGLLVVAGGGQIRGYQVEDDTFTDYAGSVTGCEGLVGESNPGFDYDDARGTFIGWAGGDSVYEIDPTTMTCTELTYANGPGEAVGNGTFGRFRYFPQLDVFALVNRWGQNAFILRL